jgi:hypothetical protein
VTMTEIIFEIYWAEKQHRTEVYVGVQVMGSIDSRVCLPLVCRIESIEIGSEIDVPRSCIVPGQNNQRYVPAIVDILQVHSTRK